MVLGLGGNALLPRGEPPTVETQRQNVVRAGVAIAEVARRHDVIVTHGNGPQVGLLALQAAQSETGFLRGLDVLGAETEGMIGYLLEQELMNQMPGREIATVLTHVEVDSTDRAFRNPTKPIGPTYGEGDAVRHAEERGWVMGRDEDGYRRVVPSPRPRAICQMRTIRRLVDAHVLVICAGGGGIPVVRQSGGRLAGADAVIDKDETSALLAWTLEADALVLLTDVEGVFRDFGTDRAECIAEASPEELSRLDLSVGSMGPKVGAAMDFVTKTGGIAAIGSLETALDVVEGRAGTRVVPEYARRGR